jgi:hypothetical protein
LSARLHDHDEQEDREVRHVRDHDPHLASIHDFHLTGPGVNKKTSVAGTGTTKWTVKLKKGTYHFVCDPHQTIMHGVLKANRRRHKPSRSVPPRRRFLARALERHNRTRSKRCHH